MNRKPRRPAFRDPAALEALGESSDPIAGLHIAHETAAVLLRTGHAADDPGVTARLVAITDEIGLSTLADLWATRPAHSLPGALWRMYLLREWVVNDPDQAAREYAAGVRFTEPDHVVAGVDPTGPQEIRRVVDEILAGAFTGDFGLALERAAAFARVVASGRAEVAGPAELGQAGKLADLATDLGACARLWRAADLE